MDGYEHPLHIFYKNQFYLNNYFEIILDSNHRDKNYTIFINLVSSRDFEMTLYLDIEDS